MAGNMKMAGNDKRGGKAETKNGGKNKKCQGNCTNTGYSNMEHW